MTKTIKKISSILILIMVSMTLFACDKEETDNKDKLENDDKITTSIVYEKDITDTSKDGYMDQFNEYNYTEEEDALALTYSKTDFEINFDGTMYDAGINIKWPYQENKQYKISFMMRSDIALPVSVITSDTHLEDFTIEKAYKEFVTYMDSSDFKQENPIDIVVNIFFGMTNEEPTENTVYIKSIIVEEIME